MKERAAALLKKTALLTGLFCAAALGLMLFQAGTGRLEAAKAPQDARTERAWTPLYALSFASDGAAPTGEGNASDAPDIVVPLSHRTLAGDIRIENRCLARQIRVYIASADSDDYRDAAILRNSEKVQDGLCMSDGADVCLQFDLDAVYECTAGLENGRMTLTLERPRQMYAHIVVLCPDSSADVSNVCASVVERCEALLAERGVKVYRPEAEAGTPAAEELASLTRETEADLFVLLTAAGNGADDGIAAYYNDVYFIRGFDNAQLASLLGYACAHATGEPEYGPLALETDGEMTDAFEALMLSEVASAAVDIGGLARTEGLRSRFSDEAWQEALARGIEAAVLEGLNRMDSLSEERLLTLEGEHEDDARE